MATSHNYCKILHNLHVTPSTFHTYKQQSYLHTLLSMSSNTIILPQMYCRDQQSRSSCSIRGWTNIFLLSFLLKDSKLCQLDE